MSQPKNIFKSLSWSMLVGLAIGGILIPYSTAVNAAPINCLAPEENKNFPPIQGDPNDSRRQVTVRFEIKSEKIVDPKLMTYASGVIIDKRKSETQGKFIYTVLTVDHNFVNPKWKSYNLLDPLNDKGEPQYRPLPNLNNPEEPVPDFPEEWQNPKVELVICNGERHTLKPENLKRLRRNFRAIENNTEGLVKDPGLDLALVEFESETEIEPAKLAASFKQLVLFSQIGVNGSPVGDDNIGKEGYSEGPIRQSNDPDYLGNTGRNGYELFYQAAKKDGSSARGMSGGPVFNSEKLVVGIHTSDGGKNTLRIQANLDSACTPDVENVSQLGSGIPINTLTDQINKMVNPDIFFGLPNGFKVSEQAIATINNDSSPEGEYNKGIFLLATAGDNKEKAIQAFDNAIAKKPDYAEAYYARGYAKFCFLPVASSISASDSASEDFRKALENKPEMLEARMALAGTLTVNKNYKDAEIQLNNAIEEAEKKAKDAEDSGEPTSDIKKASARIYIGRGLIRWIEKGENSEKQENDWDKAAKQIKELAENGPEFALEPALELASVEHRYATNEKPENQERARKRWGEALAITQENPEEDADKVFVRRFTEVLLRYYHSRDEAMKLLESLPEVTPELKEKDKALQAAKETLSDTINWADGTPKGVLNITRTPIARDRISASLDAFKVKYPDNPNVFISRAYFNYWQKKEDETIEDFKEALKLYRDTYKDEMNAKRVEEQLCRIPKYVNSPEAQGICLPNNNPTQQQNPNPTNPNTTIQNPRKPEPPIAAGPRETFYCDPSSGRVTVDRTENGDRPLISWVSNRFTPWGYDPRLRCQQVSGRLQQYRASSDLDLNRITYGRMNRRTVLCVARPERISESSATRCRGGLLILTLEPRENPEQVLREFKQVLTGTYPNPPLRKELSNPASKE